MDRAKLLFYYAEFRRLNASRICMTPRSIFKLNPLYVEYEYCTSFSSRLQQSPALVTSSRTRSYWPNCYLQDATRPLEVVSAADARFSSRVELSVRFGKTLLVLECDGVEPMLYPLARQDLMHQGPRFVVQVGDKVCRWNKYHLHATRPRSIHHKIPGQHKRCR